MDRRNKVSLWAYFDNRYETLADAVLDFHMFGRSLNNELIFKGNWVYSRTDEEAKNNSGFNPIEEPGAYLEYLRSEYDRNIEEVGHYGDFGAVFSLSLPHASSSPPNDPYNYYDIFDFDGGIDRHLSDQLLFRSERARGPAFFNLAEWTRLTELIVAWRVPRYIWFDSYLYELEGRIHKHRAWGGWLGWFPQQIDATDLPLGALTIPVGPGTLVASQQNQLQSEIPAQLDKAQKVEQALVELGLLPTKEDLIRASPRLPTSRD
ncbi:MAG: hypothetical protein AAFY65_19865 [Pseudomonadota bacterium]